VVELRDFKKDDNSLLVQHLNNERVIQYLTSRIPYPFTVEDATWWIDIGSKEGITKAIEVRGKLVGVIGVSFGENQHSRCAEIGYWLGEEYWGQGIATNSVLQMTQYVFSNTEVVRLFAPVFDPNKASMNVLEKCGYKLEGILEKRVYKNGEFFDEFLYAKVVS